MDFGRDAGSFLYELLEDLDGDRWDPCGKALEGNDRSCARDPGHDGKCLPASALCAGCGRAAGHKMSCSVDKNKSWATRPARLGSML